MPLDVLQLERTVSDVAAAAAGAGSRAGFREFMLESAARLVGSDFAVVWSGPGDADARVRGFSTTFFEHFAAAQERFGGTINAFATAAVGNGGVVSDRDVFSTTERGRLAFYAEIIKPIGSRTFLTGLVTFRGALRAIVQIGRAGLGRDFDADDATKLRALLPVVAVSEAALDATTTSTDDAARARAGAFGFTAREADVAGYVVRGFTNGEVARALSLSTHTVRNHLAAAFKKARVTTRAELVGVLLRSG